MLLVVSVKCSFVSCLGVVFSLSQAVLQSAPNTTANVGGVGKTGGSTFGATGANDGIVIFGAIGVLGALNSAPGFGAVISLNVTFSCTSVFTIFLGRIAALTCIVYGCSSIRFLSSNPYFFPLFAASVFKAETPFNFVSPKSDNNFLKVASCSLFCILADLTKAFVLLVNKPSYGYFSDLSPLPLYVSFHLLYI